MIEQELTASDSIAFGKKSFVKRVATTIRKFFVSRKPKVVVDKSQFFELERIQMENWPSVREYEMAIKEFERTRCQ